MLCRPLSWRPAMWLTLTLTGALSLTGAEDLKTAFGQRYSIRHWTSEQGLPQNNVQALAQTPDGYIWVGTWVGLARFDGMHFTLFNHNNTPAFAADAITALAVDAEGTLWIGTPEGLLCYRDYKFTRLTTEKRVSRLVPSRAGGVWMIVGRRVMRWQHGKASVNVAIQGSSYSLYEGDDGSAIVLTAESLLSVSKDGELRTLPPGPGAPLPTWKAAWPKDRSGRIWLSALNGLWRQDGGSWKQVLSQPDLSDVSHALFEDTHGNLWAHRHAAGLWLCSDNGVESIQLTERRGDQGVACFMEDREGYVWIGAAEGLYKVAFPLIHTFTPAHGLPSDHCYSVCQAPDGALWVETKGGVARIDNGQVQTFFDEPKRGHRHSVLVDRQSRVWLGNWHTGLYSWSPHIETNAYFATAGTTLEALYLDRSERLWVGTGQGVVWFTNGQPAAHWGQFNLPVYPVRSIFQSRDGPMWFGTWKAGVIRWSGPDRPSQRFTTTDGLADNRVFAFYEDPEGALWMGTHHGLSRFKNGRFSTLTTAHGLIDNLIYDILDDHAGRLWFSCNRGIFRIHLRDLHAVADGRQPRVAPVAYGTVDGMLSPEINGEHQPSGCKARDGKLWFPTPRGVSVIDPRQVEDHGEVPPLVAIEQISADHQLIFQNSGASEKIGGDLSALHQLEAGRGRVLKVRFTANAFGEPSRVRFQYRLVGHDPDWREETSERVAYYTDLRPKSYRFELKAANHRGVWSPQPAVFAFSIAPHFYQTWPFYVVCVAGLFLAALSVHHWRVGFFRRIERLERSQSLHAERARIARDLHDDLGTALTGVALEIDLLRRQTQDGIATRLSESASRVRSLAERMREVVWAVSPQCDTVSSLASFLEQQAGVLLRASGLRTHFEFPPDIPPLPLDSATRHQLALGVREALNNVLRHAHATETGVSLEFRENRLMVRVWDNGRGLDGTAPRAGHGLTNLQTRLRAVGGTCAILSRPGGGTCLELSVPIARTVPEPKT